MSRRPAAEMLSLAESRMIGCRVRELREARGVTQDALAAQAGVARSALSQLERGAARVGQAWAGALADALGTTVAGLLAEAGDGS